LRPTETAQDLTCYEIMTGAPFPLGNAYDACIRHESVIIPETSTGQTNITCRSQKDHPFPQARYITINSPVPSRANRKLAGEDFKIGDMLGPKGKVVTAGGIMALASTGLQQVEVSRRSSERKRLRIGVLTTGKEVNNPNAMNSSRNLDPDLRRDLTTVTPATLEEGHILGEPKLLFEKIEDEVIEAQIQKLQNTKMENEQVKLPLVEAKPNISFEQFAALDIRVGTILSAEKVAKTKKLLKLSIDTGLDQRTVVSGIAEHFEPEAIVGKQVSILVNLEPREIKGIVSQGMILMSENPEGKLSFAAPSEAFTNGSVIR
ncbi:MAG: hypothetical protein EOP45_20685, partial [Sphingobacteriaceae bacterium]